MKQKNICRYQHENADECYEQYSEHANMLLGRKIPKNTIRSSHYLNGKLSIYMAEASKLISYDEINI